MKHVNCTSDADCHKGEEVLNGNGKFIRQK